jgi:PAS domain S-box-containing protein
MNKGDQMRLTRNLGIQRKMQAMNLLICGAVLLVAIAALFAFQVVSFRSNFQHDTATLAAVIANNSTAAMAFKDEVSAAEAIRALQARPNVVAANLVLPDGSFFARFGKAEDARSLLQFPPPGESRFVAGQLLNTQPVLVKQERVGTLYLRSDYRQTFFRLLGVYGLIVVVVIVVSAGLGAFLSTWLGRTLTAPILKLANTAQIVGEKHDYSVRAVADARGDELGRLTKSFNEMLERIQSQDVALNLSQQKMEALINSIDGIVWERAPDSFQFTFVSCQCESILGYSAQTWLASPDFWEGKLYPPDAPKALKTSRDLAARGEQYSHEYRVLAADGRIVWMRESGMVLVENGKSTAVRGILQDITRQKQDAEELDKLNRQLIDTSRQAGMADVATGVLHNVGNVLNSVSVAATVVGERLRNSKISNLCRAATLLRDQNDHVAEFLTNDPKGKVLPDYIGTVAGQLAEEQKKLVAKMESVSRHIEHIKEIVAMQQNYAKVSGAYEHLSAAELIEDALRINSAAFDRHGIELVRDFESNLPAVFVDRHKVLQILINVLRNAKHAMADLAKDDKRLVISLGLAAPEKVRIGVRDNGIGIPNENLTKIFNHGFTTKKNGHGFGLHSGANAAKEMGGSLKGYSDGPGKGAEFVLELPTNATARKEKCLTTGV